ncbi:hypothetical protein FRB99_007066 [Tulasnella sp. 403]|nr:hypothetical protein FRB99_007066 [Tulasnella sp. 403]
MFSSDDSGSETHPNLVSPTTARSSRVNPRPYRPVRRHKRFVSTNFSTESLPTLPEYHPQDDTPPRPQPLLLSSRNNSKDVWQSESLSPPPGYPDLSSSDAIQSLLPRVKKLRRRRSIGGSGDKLDHLLERSVKALETSNALLRSSMTTHNSLAAVLSDTSFDRSVDVQIKYLSNRIGAADSRESGLDKVLEEVVDYLEADQHSATNAVVTTAVDNEVEGFLEDGISRSLPAEDHMQHLRSASSALRPSASQRRLRLSDGPRPRSPPPRPLTQYVSVESPNGCALESTSTPTSIFLPPTAGIRTTPQTAEFSPTNIPQTPVASTSPTDKPSWPVVPIPSTPVTTPPKGAPLTGSAYTMLSHIASRSSSASRSASPDIGRAIATTFRVAIPGSSAPSPSFMGGLRQSADGPLSSSPLTFDQVGDGLSASYKATASLRKILAEAEQKQTPPTSEVSIGKQRAEGERPPLIPRFTIRRPTLPTGQIPTLAALSIPTISQPSISFDEGPYQAFRRQQTVSQASTSATLVPPAPSPSPSSSSLSPSTASTEPKRRKSALKSPSGRSTPLSSGQSSPRTVTFSPLPPKHESDGSVGRAKARSKARAKAAGKKEPEKRAWWTEWLLGVPTHEADRTRSFVHTRTGAMLREEGRLHGGLESWQI